MGNIIQMSLQMRKNNRKQQQKITRVHGLIGWGQNDLSRWRERSADLAMPGQHKSESCLHTHWLFLWCSCGDLCSQPYGALCTENNIEVQKKNINWGHDWEHGKHIIFKKHTFCKPRSSVKVIRHWMSGLLILEVLSSPVPSFLLFCLCVFLCSVAPVSRPMLLSCTQQWWP